MPYHHRDIGGFVSKEVRFLEMLGSNPVLIRNALLAYGDRVAALDLDAGRRQALLERDAGKLSSLLGGRVRMAMNVIAPDGGEAQEDLPERRDDDGQAETEQPERAPPD